MYPVLRRAIGMCYVRYVERECLKKAKSLLSVAFIGGLATGIVCTRASEADQILVLGCCISILVAFDFSRSLRKRSDEDLVNRIATQLGFTQEVLRERRLAENNEKIVNEIAKTLKIENPLFKKLAIHRLQQVDRQSESLRQGVIEYYDTESWRRAYAVILRSAPVKRYQSVALVNTEGYWQDVHGKQSLDLNYELQTLKCLSIERIVIVADNLWPKRKKLPVESIADWIFEQHNHGIWVELVRASELTQVPDLLVDVGIYGDLAIGTQSLDSKSRTMKFSLSFNKTDIENGQKNWGRLRKHTTSFRKILDQGG